MNLNDKIIALLAKFFGLESDKVTELLTSEEGDGSILKDWIESRNVLTKEQHAEVVRNSKKLGVQELMNAEQVPTDLYNKIKAAVLEKKEKVLKEKYGIEEEYENFDKLLEMIHTKGSAKNKGDDQDKQLIEQLRGTITKLKNDHEQAISKKSEELKSYILEKTIEESLFAVPIDAVDDKLKVQQDVLRTMYRANRDIKVEMDEDGQVDIKVFDKSGKLLQDETLLKPKSIKEDLLEYAPNVVTIKSINGRGADSLHNSGESGDGELKGLSEAQLIEHIQGLGYDLMGDDAGKLRDSWEKANNTTFGEG